MNYFKPEATIFSKKYDTNMHTLGNAWSDERKKKNNYNTGAKGYDGQVDDMLWEGQCGLKIPRVVKPNQKKENGKLGKMIIY